MTLRTRSFADTQLDFPARQLIQVYGVYILIVFCEWYSCPVLQLNKYRFTLVAITVISYIYIYMYMYEATGKLAKKVVDNPRDTRMLRNTSVFSP